MLSCYLIVKNAAGTLPAALKSVQALADEIVVVDDGSTDGTIAIAKEAGARVYTFINPSEGEKRKYAVAQCKGDWILCLDADEEVSPPLAQEIKAELQHPRYKGYLIRFQNHFLGRPLKYGGEDYSFMRLFRKDTARLENTPIHAFHSVPEKDCGRMQSVMRHYSYRSLWQLYTKFTDYAIREAKRKKAAGEKTGLKKITMYPAHMFWARFIKDKGYKDGLFRIPLDLGFAYMEGLTYILMFVI